MIMLKVQLIGAYTGRKNARQEFLDAENKLKELGFEVFNPCKKIAHGTPWESAMIKCLKNIKKVDYIVDIGNDNNNESNGRQIERAWARQLQVPCYIISDFIKFMGDK